MLHETVLMQMQFIMVMNTAAPEEIVFKGIFNPREYEDNNVDSGEVNEGPVEEVGRWAFYYCGSNSNTNKVVVPKEVKIIREGGFYQMNKVTNFTIEIGSQLESIEYYGMTHIGNNLDDRTDSNSFSPGLKNLILPHTLKSVSESGIVYCDRFTRIIYCGNNDLNQNSSSLSNKGNHTKVYITPDYQAKNGNSIFGKEAERALSGDEMDISCSGMLPQPAPAPSPSKSYSPSPSRFQSPSSPLLNSRCSPFQLTLSPLWFFVCALLPFNLNTPSLFSSHTSQPFSRSHSCLSFQTKVPHLSLF